MPNNQLTALLMTFKSSGWVFLSTFRVKSQNIMQVFDFLLLNFVLILLVT
jgi:hypothetical protein